MTFWKQTAFKLCLALAASAGGAVLASPGLPVDWCNSGALDEVAARPWTSLGRGAVIPVSEAHRARAERRLQRRALVRVARRYAHEVTGIASREKPGHRYVLARAGMVGSPDVTISEHLERSGRIRLFGSVSRDGKTLLVVTDELSPPFPTRRLPVIVQVPNSVIRTVSRCASAI